MFGSQAAVAIENARLYGELKEQLEEGKQTEERLRENEKKYQDLYDNAPDMYFTVSPEGIVISVNQFGANQIGYSKEELIGNPVQITLSGTLVSETCKVTKHDFILHFHRKTLSSLFLLLFCFFAE